LKKNKSSKTWIQNQRRDIFFIKSKMSGYRSRSAYKLIEIIKKFGLLNIKNNVLDLGSSPGGWSQVLAEKIINGKVISVDLKPMNKIKNNIFIQGDFTDTKCQKKILSFVDGRIDGVFSDMANNTTGSKSLDSFRTGSLCLESMKFSAKILNKNGCFVSKFFMGEIFLEIKMEAEKLFDEFRIFKPDSSKSYSKESYIICKKLIN
tara:strand:- start:2206 stop:2820 length:615 start_codon:yes stop_codon:yes gene_type:complete